MGVIFRPGNVHPRSTNAHSKFGTARRKFVDAWVRYANAEILNAGPPLPFASVAQAAVKRCTNFGGAVLSVLRADTGLLYQRYRALKQRAMAAMKFGLALVLRCRSGTRIWL